MVGAVLDLRSIAITPDQAPVARLSITRAPNGSPTTFDASASTVAAAGFVEVVVTNAIGISALTRASQFRYVGSIQQVEVPCNSADCALQIGSPGFSMTSTMSCTACSLFGGVEAPITTRDAKEIIVTIPDGAQSGPVRRPPPVSLRRSTLPKDLPRILGRGVHRWIARSRRHWRRRETGHIGTGRLPLAALKGHRRIGSHRRR